MSCITLRGHWHDDIVLNVHSPTENKSNHTNDSFYEELKCLFGQFPEYHIKILLENFSAKLGKYFQTNNWD
jgi:hypothetical protein